MKSLSTMLPLSLAFGGVVATLAVVLPMDASSHTSAVLGASIASAAGAVTMVLKTVLGRGLTGNAALKALMTAQGLSFMIRLLAVALGAVVLRQDASLSAMAFVIAFFVVSLGQQALETRSLLSGSSTKVIS